MFSYSKPQVIGIVLLIVVGLIVPGGVHLAKNRSTAPPGPVRLIQPDGESAENSAPAPKPEKPRTISVHVAGKIGKPGVYELRPGDRVQDAIEAAGGASGSADLETINLAEKLQDGQQVYVAPKGRTPAPVVSVVRGGEPVSTGKQAASGDKGGSGRGKFKNPGEGTVSINGAGADELQRLPGVGPAMSQRIIDYRKANGGFKSVEELEEVKGIGPKTLAKMRPFVKL